MVNLGVNFLISFILFSRYLSNNMFTRITMIRFIIIVVVVVVVSE